MDKLEADRIRLSNKIYPIFYGLSSDLIFFIAINTLFLTEIKGLTSYDINLSATIGVLIALLFYLISPKIIKKIGNLTSIKLGTLLSLLATLLFTFSSSIIFFILAEILYEVSFVFKSVDTVILNKNLIYENKENDFIKIKSSATTIYAIMTLIVSLLAGILFNINPYLPMLINILICLINLIIAHFMYEADLKVEKFSNKVKNKFKVNKIMITSIIVYGLLYGTIAVCQTNGKLFMQYRLLDFLKTNNVAIIMSFILFLSRISRLLSNLLFNKVFNIFKNKVVYLIDITLILSVVLFIFGKIIPTALLGSIIMALGFILLLALRDPTENVLSNILLQNTKEENQEQAILYFQFASKLVVFMISLLATLILNNYELLHLYIIIFIFTVLYLFVVFKLNHLIKSKP